MIDVTNQVDSVSCLLDRLAVQQASALGIHGRYTEAEAVLAGVLSRSPRSVDAWDLQARIEAQRGRFEAARSSWRKVLELDAEHPGALAGIARIDSLRAYPVWCFWALPFALASLVLITIVCAFGWAAAQSATNRGAVQDTLQRSSVEGRQAEDAISKQLRSISHDLARSREDHARTMTRLQALRTIQTRLDASRSGLQTLQSRIKSLEKEVKLLRAQDKLRQETADR